MGGSCEVIAHGVEGRRETDVGDHDLGAGIIEDEAPLGRGQSIVDRNWHYP